MYVLAAPIPAAPALCSAANTLPLAIGPATDIHEAAKDPAVTPAAPNPAAL